jgi:phage terminase large subunit-like protein
VVSNEIVTGRLVRLACERHLRDLVDGPARGLHWDRATAQRAIDFFPAVLRHSKGQYAKLPFELLDWEQFVIGSIFGWKIRLESLDIEIRRFRTAFVSTARKNGKSTLEAGIGLKALIDEKEPGAEIYSAATTRDQARIVFSEAERMRAGSPALRRRIVKTTNNLAVLSTASWFRPLSADTSKMDGLNVFVALVDELHEHPNAEVIEKLDTGMGARLQPLMYETTTAGVSRTSVCYLHRDFSTKVLEGLIPEITADRWSPTSRRSTRGTTGRTSWLGARPIPRSARRSAGTARCSRSRTSAPRSRSRNRCRRGRIRSGVCGSISGPSSSCAGSRWTSGRVGRSRSTPRR